MQTKPVMVLVIEEHALMRASLCATIAAEPDLGILEPDASSPDAFQLRVSSHHDLLFLDRKPDIVLFSVGNPGLDDLEALQRLHLAWSSVPILAIARDELPGQEQQILAVGASSVLGSSFSRVELLSALRAML